MQDKVNQTPLFDTPTIITIERYPTKEIYTIHSVDNHTHLSQNDFETIEIINNEPLLYNRLHKEKFENKPYTIEHAKGWIHKSQERWQNKEKFEFLIRDSKNKIVAAIDIKSPDLDSAEIGYWASEHSPGIMTNAVIALCELAKKVGYKNLYGMTAPDNFKSQKVLERAGFKNIGEADRKGKKTIKFIKDLI